MPSMHLTITSGLIAPKKQSKNIETNVNEVKKTTYLIFKINMKIKILVYSMTKRNKTQNQLQSIFCNPASVPFSFTVLHVLVKVKFPKLFLEGAKFPKFLSKILIKI